MFNKVKEASKNDQSISGEGSSLDELTEKNPFEDENLPWDDPEIDTVFNRYTGSATPLRLSQYMDRMVMLVAKQKGVTMSSYIVSAVLEKVEADAESLRVKYQPEILRQNMIAMLDARMKVNAKRSKSIIMNKKQEEKSGLAQSE